METGAPGVDGQGTPVQERNSWKFGAHPSIGPISDKTMTGKWGGGALPKRQWLPYAAVPHSTKPPLPRGPGFQNAPTHGPTQPQPCAREAKQPHAAPIRDPDPAP